MRRIWILLLIVFAQCTSNHPEKDSAESFTRDAHSDTTTLLVQYWTLKDADHPLGGDIIQKENGVDYMPGIVFIRDGEMVENPAGKMHAGKYQRFGDSIDVKFDDGQSAVYLIRFISPDSMRLDRKIGKDLSTLYYDPTDTWWPNVETNPFTAANLTWTIKPKAPETDEQIKKRVQDYVRFCQYYIEGYARGNATRISFVGLPNILNYYVGGLSIPSDNDLNKKWVDCFYNSDDAFKGYTLLRHVILMKYDWDKNEKNWIKQTPSVLKAMRDSL